MVGHACRLTGATFDLYPERPCVQITATPQPGVQAKICDCANPAAAGSGCQFCGTAASRLVLWKLTLLGPLHHFLRADSRWQSEQLLVRWFYFINEISWYQLIAYASVSTIS